MRRRVLDRALKSNGCLSQACSAAEILAAFSLRKAIFICGKVKAA